MTTYTIYHNPRCGKSRDALKLLRDHGIEPTIVEYLKTPLNAKQLDQLLTLLALPPEAVIRFKEPIAIELGLHKADARTRAEWLKLLVEHPILLERPIVVNGKRAVLGRPLENVSALLSDAP
jgi:arsenate reductase